MGLFSFKSPSLDEKVIHDILRPDEKSEDKAEPRHGAATPELEQTEKGIIKEDSTVEVFLSK